jgi:hypothetical protein
MDMQPCKPIIDVPECPPKGVNSYWSAWGCWEECDAHCGKKGQRARTRICLSIKRGKAGDCPGKATKKDVCESNCYTEEGRRQLII